MSFQLRPFDGKTHGFSLEITVHFRHDEAFVEYIIKGPLSNLLLPPTTEGRGRDLWKQSCVELFIHPHGKEAYREYNFSLSGAWDAFDFSSYRQGTPAILSQEPPILLRKSINTLRLSTVLPRTELERHPCNVAAILQLQSGERTFWAVSHSGAQADFHIAEDCLCRFEDPSSLSATEQEHNFLTQIHLLRERNNA